MVFNMVLIIVLIICVVTDIRKRLIYNKVIFPALILSLILHLILNGWSGLAASLLGFLIGIGILLIPYFMGGIGAGDVKLLALIGALKGPLFVLNTSIYMALLGGVIAICILIFNGGAFSRLKYYFHWLYAKKSGLTVPLAMTKDSLKSTYPYGVAIAGGAILSIVGKAWIS
ncbi:A24 family peptidase [Pseudalkalibacillus sp. Hm43]|uniref:A24 family peptidase n=1 Tax=Pseudalkalibacillus sp. Hm43 TaxID=3450742 RepID=UPI003F43CBF5